MTQTDHTGLLVPLNEEYHYLTEIQSAIRTVESDGCHYCEVRPHGGEEPILVHVLEDMGPMHPALAVLGQVRKLNRAIVAQSS